MRNQPMRLLVCLAIFLAGTIVAWGQTGSSLDLPSLGGGVMLDDDQTLVVSIPSEGQLFYVDTSAEKLQRQVGLEFQPTCLAVQRKKLFAAVRGAAVIHILNAATAEQVTEICLPGEPVQALACHRTQGLLYAANTQNEVYAIDAKSHAVTKTDAIGQLLDIDPTGGRFLYTAVQKPIQDVILMEERPGSEVRISLAQAHIRAVMLKYAVHQQGLKLVSANDNPADNGRALAVSGDGKRIAMAGGGGWRPRNDLRRSYVITVFDAGNLHTMLGQIETGPYPGGIAFHPLLPLGAAFRHGHDPGIILFDAKSLVRKAVYPVSRAGVTALLTFGGRGTKLVYGSQPLIPGRTEPCVLEFFPVEITDNDKKVLQQAYGK
jgi:hypothetical protein